MKNATLRAWLILFGLQLFVILIVFSRFISGQFYFAYIDIGSDSFGQVVPFAMHMARTLASEGFTGWSFESGLGSPTALWLGDVFGLLSQLGGPDHVLPFRVWVYVLKLVLGGAAFFVFVRAYVTRWETVVISALAYSFCGYAVINGQWDSEASAFIFFPLILWAINRHLRSAKVIALPLVVALSLVSGVFFVALAVFLMLCCLAFVLTSPEPKVMLKAWLLKILPLTVIGYLLASPILLPIVLQLMDSSRVGGGQSLFQKILEQSLRLNDWPLINAEIGGLFHKDIFGIGSLYKGYWNYFEGPGFYIGIILLLLIPQIWNGSAKERRVLLLGIGAVILYFLFPVFRYAAMGFAVPYFRVSTLWVTLILLMLAAKAVDQVLVNGVSGRLGLVGAVSCVALLALVTQGGMGANVWQPHVTKVSALAVLAVATLLLANRKILSARLVPFSLMSLVVIETVVIAAPSYIENRVPVTPAQQLYDDGTLEALKAIRQIDKGVFRIEKTYHSVSLDDALAQDYMGVKSYFLHGRGEVDFYIGLGLIPPAQAATAVNYTNWLPNVGPRFVLNSLLGVKYIIAREPVQWPGFVATIKGANYQIYRNELALPLGIVQTKQITQREFATLYAKPERDANFFRDIAIFNAAVVPELIPGYGDAFDLNDLASSKTVSLQDRYINPALVLQATGLRIQQFASNHIVGSIHPEKPGILVFSIPFNQGWSLKIDGQDTATIRANFGMLGAPIQAGEHSVVLDFRLPGQRTGFLLGALGCALLFLALTFRRRRESAGRGISRRLH